jgi:hypothetical protein
MNGKTLVRNGLKRPCKRCERIFLPTGRDCRICEKCKRKKYLEGQLKRMEKLKK